MNTIELYINGLSVDFGDDLGIQLDKIVSEYRDPLKKTGTFSLPLTLPETQRNIAIFNGENDKQVLGKFRKTYPAQLIVNDEVLIDGVFLHQKNTRKGTRGFTGAVGEVKVGSPKLGDLLKDKKLQEIRSFTRLNFQGRESIIDSWRDLVAYPDAEVCYPLVATSFVQLRTGFQGVTYEDLGVSHFVAGVLKNIFTDAGYTVQGDIFSSPTFQKLVMLYSNPERQKWNYGTLAPFGAELPSLPLGGGYQLYAQAPIERQSDRVFVLNYPWVADSGDLCTSLGVDGVYTCKQSGLHQFRLRAEHQALTTAGNIVQGEAFTVLRNITDSETIPEAMLPPVGSSFSSPSLAQLDSGTLAVGNGTFTFTARLEEGKQYAVQRYVSITKATNNGTLNFISDVPGGFRLLSVDAPLTVNPADFLPDMSQADFVQAVFHLFNLYYVLNEEEKTVTLLTRDDFFQETLQDIVDLTPYTNLDEMDDLPFSTQEIGKTYLSYLTDESDHILKVTDYLERVNGEQPEESTQLPFAPLPFLRVSIQDGTTVGEDLLPAILPAQTNEDSGVLTDVETFTPVGSWVPRLCLYHGNDWIQTDLNPGYQTPVSYEVQELGTIPKLGFFDVTSQPSYTVVENVNLRSFALELATGSTIYSNGGNSDFLQDVNRIPEMETVSLAANTDTEINPKGIFYRLYANDILIGSLSNYIEGVGRMTPILFTRLTGRQTIRIDQDLYLLESVKNYDIQKGMAILKLYRLVGNASSFSLDGVHYSSTQTVTVSCPAGQTGNDETATATRTSFISQDAADTAATAEATRLAEAKLVCTVTGSPTSYTSTQTVTLYCDSGYYGPPSTATVTTISYISQAEADQTAYNMAYAEALGTLSCTPDDNP